MSTVEALVYRFAFDLARRTVIGAGNGEELIGVWLFSVGPFLSI